MTDPITITSAHAQGRRLTSFLVDAGTITEDQVQEALVHLRITGARIGETLVELGLATEEDIAWALARQLSIPFVDVQVDMLDKELVGKFPPSLLDRLQAVPLIRTDGTLSTAMADPTDTDAVASLEHYAGARIEISVATPSAISRVLREVCQVPATGVHANAHSGAAFLTAQLTDALAAGASELYWMAGPAGLQTSRRLGGRLVAWTTEPAHLLAPLLNRLEALGLPAPNLGTANHRAGRIKVEIDGRDVPVDVSVLIHERGTAIRLRPSAIECSPRTLAELGLDPAGEQAIREALAHRAGLVIVNAHPGAGGSTTLSCLMAAASGTDRRILVLASASPRRGLDPPPDALLVTVPSRIGASYWEEIVTGQDPEVVVLDDLTSGDRIGLALSPALAGRVVIAATDWDDPFALLEFLATSPRTRAAACNRLRIVLGQRRARAGAAMGRVAHSAWEQSRFDPLVISSPLRTALGTGASAAELYAIAALEGYRAPSSLLDEAVDPQAIERAKVQRTSS
jgi:MSHA biogenesis protein MshE